MHLTALDKELGPVAGLPTLCFKKVWKLREVLNIHVTAGHRPAHPGPGGASWVRALFLFLSKVTEILCKIESKFSNSSVLADGFVMRCAKKSLGFEHI